MHVDIECNRNSVSVRIGKPDQNLINDAPSLVRQLEVEAEFETNKRKFRRKSKNNNGREIQQNSSAIRNAAQSN